MELKEAKDFKEAYLSWLHENISVTEMGDYFRIITPFLDRYNDHLILYAKEEQGIYTLTDDGYVINELALAGAEPSSGRRLKLLNEIVAGYGVKVEKDELVVTATPRDFAQKKHMLLQAMMTVDDLFMTSRSRVSSLFFEEIAQFLSHHDVRYSESLQLAGLSGLSHKVDFLIPSSKKAPERMVKAINSPTRTNIESVLFTYSDVKETRKQDLKLVVFLNDREASVSDSLLGALETYSALPIPWSQKEKHVQELVA